MTKKLYTAGFAYLILGLASGVFYREFTKMKDFGPENFTQLSVLHTHLLALGMMMMLGFLALEKLFSFSTASPKLSASFFWLYNAGVVLTSVMMTWHGILNVLGEPNNKMMQGFAGLGHMLITAGLICFFLALGKALKRSTPTVQAPQEHAVSA